MRTIRWSCAAIVGVVLFQSLSGAETLRSIRTVDFKNFTYEGSDCAMTPDKRLQVTNGDRYNVFGEDEERTDDVRSSFFFVKDIVYGDLTGDGHEEAFISTLCSTGGTGRFWEGFVYELNKGVPQLRAPLPDENHGNSWIKKARIRNGRLTITYAETRSDPEADSYEIQSYRLKMNALVPIGKARRIEKRR